MLIMSLPVPLLAMTPINRAFVCIVLYDCMITVQWTITIDKLTDLSHFNSFRGYYQLIVLNCVY